jgi:endonuclease/exonuclease/phosphatase family metal-dependent hydrolase
VKLDDEAGLSHSEEVVLITTREEACLRFARLKKAVRRLLQASSGQKMARQVVAVAEPPGRATLRRLPPQPPPQSCELVTVLSANLWHDFPRYRRQEERLEHFAGLAEQVGADILLLQEVSRRPAMHVDRWLAERLGMSFVYSRSNGHPEIGFEEGLAIFSRYPFAGEPLHHQLGQSCNPFVRRMALAVEVQTACGPLLALSVHLALSPAQNVRQLTSLTDWIERFPAGRALVVGGDFNASEHTHHIRRAGRQWTDTFRRLHPHADGATHAISAPWGASWLRRRLDYIFLRAGPTPWRVVEARHLQLSSQPHSDHLSVLARLAYEQNV